MSAANRIELAEPGDLILYGGFFADSYRIGRFVSVSAMMFRVEPYERGWRTSQWDWGKPVSMGKGKYRRRIPREVWKDDAFVCKLQEALALEARRYSEARAALTDEHARARDALLDDAGAAPK